MKRLALVIRCWPLIPSAMLVAVEASTETAETFACGPTTWAEVATSSGIDFIHDRGTTAAKHLPETMGAGLAWLDFDGDGWWDLYLVQSGAFPPVRDARARNRLFRNLGGRQFADVTETTGTGDLGCGQGVVAADVDGDGGTDLFVTNFGTNVLFINDRGRFVDRTAAADLQLEGWSSSAALADADGDGDLDLYVSRYVEYDPNHELFCGDAESGEREYCDPSLFLGATDRFYENQGHGTFADTTAPAGFSGAGGRGLGVLFADLDDDLLPEVYVANDLNPNLLFRNLGRGRFEEISLFSGTAVNREGKPEAGMGVAIGDVDGDLDPDLVVTNFDVETNTFYRNLGELLFEDVSSISGFGLPSFNLLVFGVVLADLDGDGNLDAYTATGHIFDQPKRENVLFAQRDQLLMGDGAGGFIEVRCEALEQRPTVGRGLAGADFDNDGDVDLGTQENGGPFSLLRNEADPQEWLGVILRGAAPNVEGVGAQVTVTSGSKRLVRWVVAGDSYQSSSDRRVVFGLVDRQAASVEVRWRSGKRQRLDSPQSNRYLVISE